MSGSNTGQIETETYQRIVVPTDGSDGANYAAEHGLMLAEALEATAHIISVVEGAGSQQRDHLRSSPEELTAEAVEKVRERAHGLNIRTETATLEGTPKEAILQYVEDQSIDMIVMGTHGRTGLDQVVFGSIAEDVLRESPVPVLTVKPPQWED